MTLCKHRLGADINEYDWCELSWFVDVFPWSHSMYITTYQYRLVEQAWWLCACPVWPKFKLRLKLILYIRMNSDIFGRTTQGPPKVKPQNLTYLLGLFDVRPGVLNVFFAHLQTKVFLSSFPIGNFLDCVQSMQLQYRYLVPVNSFFFFLSYLSLVHYSLVLH